MEKLLERLKNGDMNAFDEIVEYYEKKLYYIALAKTKDEIISKEAVQDTFINLYMNVKKLYQVENFNSWIIKILINCCNKKYIKKKYTEVSYEDISADSFICDEYELDKLVSKMDFFDIISILNEEDRTIMALYYMDNYNTIEIAEILNMNESTVRTKMRRSREKIRKRIEDGENNER